VAGAVYGIRQEHAVIEGAGLQQDTSSEDIVLIPHVEKVDGRDLDEQAPQLDLK
jgi:hypothetical protein